MGHTFTRVATAVVVVGGFVVVWISTWLESDLATWMIYGLWGLLAVGLLLNLIRGRRSRRTTSAEAAHLDADPIQAIYQGRRPPTFVQTSVDESSQVVDRPHPDPLQLPDPPQSR